MKSLHYLLGLDSLLEPLTRQAFLQSYFGQRVLTLPGTPTRFSALMPWAALNDLLENQQFSSTRFHVLKNGNCVDQHLFTRRGEAHSPLKLLPAALTAHLRGGATLVIDAMDDLYGPITRLARCLERDLLAGVAVNMSVGFGTSEFYHTWNQDDVFILQVAGRTRWQVLGQAYGFPPIERTIQTMSRPLNGVVWEGVLNDGDSLYIPRGWWCGGALCGEPTIYLSAALSNPTGLSMLQSLSDVLKDHECLRTDLPRFSDDAGRIRYMEAFRAAVIETINSPDLLPCFLARMDGQAAPRPSFGLPWSATASVFPEAGGYIDLLAPRGLIMGAADTEDSIEVLTEGTSVRFHRAAVPLLRYVKDHTRPSVADFMSAFQHLFEREQLRDFLVALVDYGLISIRDTLL